MEEMQKENPYDSASILSHIFFWWFNQFAVIGLKRKFEETDLCKQPKAEDSELLGNLLQKEWNHELKMKNPSLLKSLFRVFGKKCLIVFLLNLTEECVLLVLQAYLIGIMIDYFENKLEEKKLIASISAAGVCCCLLLFIIFFHTFLFLSARLNIRIAVSLSNIIYRKALKINYASVGKSHIGQMVNLLSNDINKFQQCVNCSVYLVSGPLQVIITIIILWQYLGPSVLAGMLIVFLYVPLQIGLGRILSSLRFKTAKQSDKRLHLLNELLAGLRIIKMYAWELLFAKTVEKTRRKELKNIKISLFSHGIPYIMGIIMTKLMMFFSFFTYFMTEGKLTATIAFVTSSLLVTTYKSMFVFFPRAVLIVVEAVVSIKRLQKFLLLEEQQSRNDDEVSRPCLKDCGVWVENIFASWNKDTEPTLQNITMNALPGDLLVIVGSVGSGKTSLLMTLLGEIPISSGKVILKGKISYASQEPWIYNGTIRENILFYDDYNEKKYKEVLFVSALEKDITDFPEGDLSRVGERGRIMSGGQKSRINLARALYHDADIFILDDPLSAVDVPVAKHIFENCIKKFLKDKVTILATHQIQFLKSATKIILLKEGKVKAVGDYNEMIRLGINFGILSERRKTEIESFSISPQLSFRDKNEFRSNVSHDGKNATQDIGTKQMKIEDKTKEHENSDEKRKMKLSRRAIAYTNYVNAGAGRIFQIAVLFVFLFAQVLLNGSDYWLVKWTNRDFNYLIEKSKSVNCTLKANKSINISNYTESLLSSDINEETNMYIYSGLIFGLIIVSLIGTVSYFILCMRCSENLHKNLLHCIIRIPVAFLDKNPVGELLSRFSRDMGIVDQQLPVYTLFVLNTFINILGMIILQIIIQPYLVIPSLILLSAIGLLSYYFIGITSEIFRLEGTTSSPIYSHLSTSLYGISTIRAFKAERSFEYAFNKHQNKHTSCKFLSTCITHWNITKIHISCFISIVITVITIFNISLSITAGEVGLIMSYSSTITVTFVHIFHNMVMTVGQLISVERVLDYSKLPSEASPTSSPDKKPPNSWPQEGAIDFHDVSLQYEGDTQHVLKNLNFHIRPREKIGIVGRTGAGKSSIIAALFRMTETTGIISIDGIITKDIGLHDLRSKISIIPQDPLLFSGSIRRNIDPLNKHVDETLWKVLEEVKLKNAVQNLKGGLDAELAEGGSNFSVGQRQLICLARAILHQNRILVLDEATAFIDKETDSLIQKTIREKFFSSTILTIAHRLQTIMDSDRILVLRDGKIEEFDEPYVLLKNSNGIFYNMAKMTGREMRKHLYNIAVKTHFETNDKNQNLNINNSDLNEQSGKFCKETKMKEIVL